MDALVNISEAAQTLDLDNIRFQLIRLEDTITFHLIERVQFALNPNIYIPGAVSLPDPSLSFMDWYLREQERLQSLIRRYESPDEYPFFPTALNAPILKPLNYPRILHPNNVNVNPQIKSFYTQVFLPKVCPSFSNCTDRGESQEHYGSAATCDISVLQALSRRIHFGKFVAESKFQSERQRFTALIRAGDRQGIGAAITNEAVEKQVLERLRLKAETYGTDPSRPEEQAKINVEAIVSMYKDFVIPLTKEVEVDYLLRRLEGDE